MIPERTNELLDQALERARLAGYEQALQHLVTAGAVRAANDAFWGRQTGGVLDALQAAADHLRERMGER